MVLLRVDKLNPGAVLAGDVRDINSRLLLAKGQKIDHQHIRILKMWGIFEVPVEAQVGAAAAADDILDSARTKAAGQAVADIFSAVDSDHPTVKELMRLSVRYRAQHSRAGAQPPKPSGVVAGKPVSSQETLRRLDRLDIKLPEVPSLVFELNEIISDPMSSGADIAQVVTKSPSLTALLLKIVNSAFYGFRSKIDSISRAVLLIGSREVSNLALGITVMETFRGISKEVIDVASFLEHNLACGVMAKVLAAYGNIAHTEQLFVSGMLHDIGRLILCKYFPQLFQHAFCEAARMGVPLLKAEQAVLGCTHVHLGKRLLTKWKLPYALENNVCFHHNPSASPNPEMAAAVQMADMIVHGLGVGSSAESVVPSFDSGAWERVKLSVGALEPIIQQGLHQIENFRQVLQQG